jgi:hypothetical protein
MPEHLHAFSSTGFSLCGFRFGPCTSRKAHRLKSVLRIARL